ncbi:MAG: head GIN domain-containing protein [Flavobacteriaceae bacterium]
MKFLKVSFLVFVFFTTTSCEFNLPFESIEGNGNVIKDDRMFKEKIDVVKASNGLEVFLVESYLQIVSVEADENLQEHIITELIDGTLHVKTDKNIRNAKSKKVTIAFVELNGLQASSGASIKSLSSMLSNDLFVKASSGSQMDLSLIARELIVESSSGSTINLRGQARNFNSKASSGSSIDARELESIYCTSKASSGGDITLNIIRSLDAKASSGGSIKYYGEPEVVNQNKSTSGSVRKM